MGLLGSFGSVSLDRQIERMEALRTMLIKQLRTQLGRIQRDVEFSAQNFRNLLAGINPSLAEMFAVRSGLGLGRAQAETIRSLYDAVKAASPEAAGARAREDMAQALDAERLNTLQRLAQAGVDPTTVRGTALDRGLEIGRAAALAQAGTLGRLAGAEQQAKLATTALGADQGSLAGAAGLLGGLYGSVASLRSGVLGNPSQQAGAAAQLLQQEAALRLSEAQSKASALGSLLGTGLGLGGLALGGYIMSQPSAFDKLLASVVASSTKPKPAGIE